MAEDVTPREAPTAREATVVEAEPAIPVGAARTPSRAERARRDGYRRRFALVYFLLAVVAGAAIGSFAVVLGKPHARAATPWSSFQPTGSADAQIRQIATRVGAEYRLANNEKLVAVIAGRPQYTELTSATTAAQVAVSTIAVRPDTSTGKHEATDIQVVDAQRTVSYTLCGLGASCAIVGGKASTARHALLRREALELSLYTFKYVGGVDAVLVSLPPKPSAQVGTSVFLQRGDISRELGVPLERTLSPRTPRIGGMSKAELATVDRITLPRLYTPEYRSGPDLSPILVLTPIPNQT